MGCCGGAQRDEAILNTKNMDELINVMKKKKNDIPIEKKGKESYLEPWTFTSNDNRFVMTFKPIIDRHADTDLKILCSLQHQVFGVFNGTMILDDGTQVKIVNQIGFAEKVFNKW